MNYIVLLTNRTYISIFPGEMLKRGDSYIFIESFGGVRTLTFNKNEVAVILCKEEESAGYKIVK